MTAERLSRNGQRHLGAGERNGNINLARHTLPSSLCNIVRILFRDVISDRRVS